MYWIKVLMVDFAEYRNCTQCNASLNNEIAYLLISKDMEIAEMKCTKCFQQHCLLCDYETI